MDDNMNTLAKQHLGTFMVFYTIDGAFAFYNANTPERAEEMFVNDHPDKLPVIKIQTVEENLREACASEETFQRLLKQYQER